MYVCFHLNWMLLVAAVAFVMWCVARYPQAVVPIATGVAVAGLLYTIMDL